MEKNISDSSKQIEELKQQKTNLDTEKNNLEMELKEAKFVIYEMIICRIQISINCRFSIVITTNEVI